MTETTPGREPVQIVEIEQPFCANKYGLAPCRAGLGTVDTSALSVNFATAGLGSGYVADNASLSLATGGIRVDATAADSRIRLEGASPGFSGDTMRYVVVHGKLNVTPASFEWFIFYGTASLAFSADRRMAAKNLNTAFRGVTLNSLVAGQEFVAVFDAADSTNYATDWVGEEITRLRFDLTNLDTGDFDIYSITVCSQDLTAAGDTACFGTFASCGDKTNYALGAPLKLYFSHGYLSERDVPGLPYVLPFLQSVSTAPTRINMSAADLNSGGLGNRANCQIVLKDVPHTDRVVDPYVDGRSWDTMDGSRGTFWTRWLARNKYRQNMVIRVYEGYRGQALAAMKSRTYFLQEVSPPASGEGASITLTGMDILAKLEERKAQVPAASPGKLTLAITAVATSFEVSNAVTTDYPAPGTVRCGSEIMTYASVTASANGVTLGGVVRGTDKSTAATHEQDATVQICWRLTDRAVESALQELLETWGGIATSWLNLTQWTAELGVYLVSYRLNGLVTEPTPVSQIVGEFCEQALFFIWWDERVAKVSVKAIRGVDEEPPLLTEGEHIVEGTFQLMEMPRERASQVWIYYDPQSFTGSVTDTKTYEQIFIEARLDSETEEQYGEASVKKIYARFLNSDALASNTGAKYINRHVDVPNACTFHLDAKDRDQWLGATIRIEHFRDVDVYGAPLIRTWTIISAEEVAYGERLEVECRDTTPYGKVNFIMASGAANYPGATLAPFKNFYIGNADGLLSDGTPCARIS